MKPDCSTYLRTLARVLADEFAPRAGGVYERTELVRHAGLLSVVDEALDGAAAWRFDENRALRRLFAQAATVLDGDDLAPRLRSEAAADDPDLRIRALEATNHRLRALMIELHVRIEALEGDAARALEDAIWRELSASTDRRRLAVGRF